MTDLEILLEYLSTQWLPKDVKAAYDRLKRQESLSMPLIAVGRLSLDVISNNGGKATAETQS